MSSYAYDDNNIGHKYINSLELDKDLARVAKQMKAKRRRKYGYFNNRSSRHT